MYCVLQLSQNLVAPSVMVDRQKASSWLRFGKPFQMHFASSFPKHSCASVFLSQYLPGREMCPSLLFNCMKCCTAIRWCHSSVLCPTSLPLTAGFGGAWELVADVYVTRSSLALSLKTDMSPRQSGIDVSCNSFFYCAFLPVRSRSPESWLGLCQLIIFFLNALFSNVKPEGTQNSSMALDVGNL